MFPYVCLSSLILFCSSEKLSLNMSLFSKKAQRRGKDSSDPPKRRSKQRQAIPNFINAGSESTSSALNGPTRRNPRKENHWTTLFLLAYISLQITLPFTHSVTKVSHFSSISGLEMHLDEKIVILYNAGLQ